MIKNLILLGVFLLSSQTYAHVFWTHELSNKNPVIRKVIIKENVLTIVTHTSKGNPLQEEVENMKACLGESHPGLQIRRIENLDHNHWQPDSDDKTKVRYHLAVISTDSETQDPSYINYGIFSTMLGYLPIHEDRNYEDLLKEYGLYLQNAETDDCEAIFTNKESQTAAIGKEENKKKPAKKSVQHGVLFVGGMGLIFPFSQHDFSQKKKK
jgi:hypothetical protein